MPDVLAELTAGWSDCRIEDAESQLRQLLAEHKKMFSAEEQQQELEHHQQQAALQRTQGANKQQKR